MLFSKEKLHQQKDKVLTLSCPTKVQLKDLNVGVPMYIDLKYSYSCYYYRKYYLVTSYILSEYYFCYLVKHYS